MPVVPEIRHVALMPRSFSCCTWSFINEISGDTTRQIPSMAMAGI